MQATLTHPTYHDIEKGCAIISNYVLKKCWHVERVIGISRGGLIPAVIISHLLDIPMTPAKYSSTIGVGETKDPEVILPSVTKPAPSGLGIAPLPLSLLIIDDIVDSGNTLKEVQQHYKDQGHVAYTASVYFKDLDSETIFIPDVYWKSIPHDSKWVEFPWET